MVDWQRVGKLIFGGEGPKENERRYMANAEVKLIVDTAEPWTVEGLRAELARWIGEQT